MAELAAAGLTPLEAVFQSVEASGSQSFTILADGVPCAVFGVVAAAQDPGPPTHDFAVPEEPQEPQGIPWMLGTDLMLTIPRDLMVQGLYWIDYLNLLYPFLQNYVSDDNLVSVSWLQRMGFEFHEGYCINGTIFRRFTRGNLPSE